MAETATKSKEHFAIGLVVDVKPGSKPAGWGDDPFTEDVPTYRTVEEVAGSEPGYPFGTFNVGGWYWSPADVNVR